MTQFDNVAAADHPELQQDAFQTALGNPAAAQAATLFQILKSAARTGFGVKQRFGGITTIAEFRASVPASGMHAHRSMIELQKASGAEILTMDEVFTYVPAFSSGQRNLLCPITVQDMFNRQQLMSNSLSMIAGAGAGRMLDLSVLNTSTYSVSPSGTECRITDFQWLATVEDRETRAYLVCLLAAAMDNMVGLISADLAAFVRLSGVLQRHGEHILSDLKARTVRVHDRIDEITSCKVRELMDPSAQTIDRLQRAMNSKGEIRLADLFPALVKVSFDASTGDSSWLAEELPEGTRLCDLGCSLPEGLLSIGYGDAIGTVPALLNVFFEFSDPGTGEMIGLHQIAEGTNYDTYVTTTSGLYRCKLSVTTRVVGWEGRCPRLDFTRHSFCGSNSASLAVIEPGAALSAVQSVLSDLGAPRPFVRLSSRSDGGFRITLSRCSVEALTARSVQAAVDSHLRRTSLHYDRLRECGVMATVDVIASSVSRTSASAGSTKTDCTAA